MKLFFVFFTVIFGIASSQIVPALERESLFFDIENWLQSDELFDILASNEIGKRCETDFYTWIDGFQHIEFWALQMVDSMTKFFDGVLMGRLHYPGHFDECVNVRHVNFTGKHCMFQAFPANLVNQNLSSELQQALESILSFNYGVCMPSSCSSQEINHLMTNLNKIDLFKFHNLTENDCSTYEWRPYRAEDKTAVAILLIILILAVASTAYDLVHVYSTKISSPNELLLSFSLYSNGKHLLRLSPNVGQLKCLNGIRFLSIAWIILGHCYITYAMAAPINLVEVPGYFRSVPFTPVNNAFVAVDTFFFLSGLLVCLVFFRDISKKGSFDAPVSFVHRYIRLTPPFAMVILLQSTVITRIGNGPFWNKNMDRAQNDCRKSWWSSILYVQNYVSPDALCLGQSWYLSADMQMFWFSPLVLYPMLTWPALAPFFLLSLIFLAVVINFTVAYIYDLAPNLSIALSKGIVDQFKLDYAPFHMRLSSWLVGLATGYVICGVRANKIRISLTKTMVIVGWTIGLGLLLSSFFTIIRFLENDYTSLESAFFLAFHRIGWTFGLAWITIACVTGYGGPVNQILSLDLFQPLAKISYCLFLVHMTLQTYRLFSSRTNQYIRHFEIVYNYVGDLIFGTLLAVPLTLLFEIPFTKLDRYFLQKIKIFPYPRKRKGYMKDAIKASKNVEEGIDNPNCKE